MALDVLFRRVWKLDCQITGILAGTNTRHNAEPDMSEAQLASGKLVSYVFSQAHNRISGRDTIRQGETTWRWKSSFPPPFPGFRGFSGPDWEERSLRPDTDSRARQAAQIQEGILDFCRLYLESGVGKYLPRISGRRCGAGLPVDGSRTEKHGKRRYPVRSGLTGMAGSEPKQKSKKDKGYIKKMKPGKKTLYSRKIISLLAAVLSALLLSACGGAKTEGDQQTAEAAENAGQQELPEEDADAPESQTAQNGSGRPETEAAEADAAGTNAAGTAGAAENAGDETAGDETASNSLSAWLTEEGYLDLDSLHRINPDIYAWLDIPGTDISFPILQSAEDEYFYLSHNESKEADDGGCIYTEYFNRKDFSDPNTVIYGRNVDGRIRSASSVPGQGFL